MKKTIIFGIVLILLSSFVFGLNDADTSHYWTYDESSGDLIDQVSTFDGTNTGVAYQQTKLSTGGLFSYQYVDNSDFTIISDNIYYSGTSDWCIAGWFNTTKTTTAYVWETRPDADNSVGISFGTSTSAGKISGFAKDGTDFTQQFSTNTYNDGNPHYIVWCYDSLEDKFILDIDSGTERLTTGVANFDGMNTNGNTCFGYSCYGSDYSISGNLDEFLYYNDMLTTDDISDLYGGEVYPFTGGGGGSLFTLTAKTNQTETSITNFTATLSSGNFTQTTTTNNGTIYFDIPENEYNLNITSTGYAFFYKNIGTQNNSNSYTAYLYENNSIKINIFDGVSFNLLNGTNINFIIDGQDTTYYNLFNTSNGTYFLDDLDADTYKFTFYNDDYPRQNYFVTLEDNEYKELDAFILNNTFVSNVNIIIKDPYDVNVENSTLTMQQSIDGLYQTISQETTDATGTSLFYLQIGINYRCLVSKTGYVTQTASITPTTNPYSVTIKLSPVSTYNYTLPLSCVDTFLTLPTEGAINKGNQSFNMSLSSPDGELSYFGIYYNDTTKTNVTGSPSGGSTNLNFNVSNTEEPFTIQYFFKCSGKDLFVRNKSFFVDLANYSNSTLTSSLSEYKDQITLIQKLIFILAAIIVSLLVCYELQLPQESYPFAVSVVLIIYTLPGIAWIDPILTSFLCLILIVPTIANWKEGGLFG